MAKHWRISLFIPVLFLAGLLIFTSKFSPLEAGPAGIMLVFLMLYGLSLSICFWIVYLGPNLLSRLGFKRNRDQLSIRKAYYLATVIATLPLLLITIQAINQLRLLDVLLVILLLSLAVFYVNRRF